MLLVLVLIITEVPILAGYTEFFGCEKWKKITRYVSTQWLSLQQCCGCETKRFEALKSRFLLEDEKDNTKRFKRLSNDFADRLTEVHVAFFTATLPIFMNYNKFLQRNDPLPRKVLPMTKSLVRKQGDSFYMTNSSQILQSI